MVQGVKGCTSIPTETPLQVWAGAEHGGTAVNGIDGAPALTEYLLVKLEMVNTKMEKTLGLSSEKNAQPVS